MKRSEEANWKLRRRRPLFFQIGLILSISAALYAFNFNSEVQDYYVLDAQKTKDWDIEIVPDFRVEKPKPMKTPEPKDPGSDLSKEPVSFDEGKPEVDPEPVNDIDLFIREQITGPELVEPETHIYVPKMPEFPGGEQAMFNFINSNMKYPAYAKENGCEGRVMVSFVVNPDGFVMDVKAEEDPGCGLAEEAVRVFKMMPRWKPGSNNFRPVRVRLWAPVVFELN